MSIASTKRDTCIEVKHYPDGRKVAFDCDLLAIEPARQLLGYTIQRATNVAGVFLPAGTRSYGCFWAGRSYNLYLWVRQLHGRRDELVGAYFNICDSVQLGLHELRWRDLWLDMLVLPSRRLITLDRAEVPSGLPRGLVVQMESAVSILQARSSELIDECLCWAATLRRSPA